MRSLPIAVGGLVLALGLTACGGGGKETPTTTTQPASAPPIATLPDDPADVRRAAALGPSLADITAAAQAANPTRVDKQAAQPTDYRGNPDLKAEREQCGLGAAKGPQDTGFGEGPAGLIKDPLTNKTLLVASQGLVAKTDAARELKIRSVKDPVTISCMQSVLDQRARAERVKRDVTEAQLTATQTVEPLVLPGLGSSTVAYRIHLTVSLQGGSTIDQYVDLLMTFVGRAQISVVVESAEGPPSPEFDARIVDRMRANAIRVMAS